MKKSIIYIMLLALMPVFNACTREVEDLFDTSAAQRLEEAMNDIEKILVAAPNGWEMRYYAQPETAGYVLLVKFDASGKATVAAKNTLTKNKYAIDDSSWEVIGDNGPVITFNSYNDVLHLFSDPQNNGIGMGGDYEFIVLDWSDGSHLRLKGKKAEAYIDMMPVEASETWEGYFAKTDAFNAVVFTNNDGAIFSFSDGETMRDVKYDSNLFQFVDETQYMGFIVLPAGIEFYSGLEAKGGTARHFALNEDKSALVCTDEGILASFVAGETATEYFTTYMEYSPKRKWTFNLNKMGSAAQTAYADITTAFEKAGVTFKGIEANYNSEKKQYNIKTTFRIKGVNSDKNGFWYGTFKQTAKGLYFEFLEADELGEELFNRAGNKDIEAGKAMLIDGFFGKEFILSPHSGGTLNYSELRLTSVEDENFYLVCYK